MIKAMIELQKATGFTDQQFAEMLGITRVWWNSLKNGQVELTPRVKELAVKTFPALRKAFLEDLKV